MLYYLSKWLVTWLAVICSAAATATLSFCLTGQFFVLTFFMQGFDPKKTLVDAAAGLLQVGFPY